MTAGIQGERGSFYCPIGEYLISKGHDGPEVSVCTLQLKLHGQKFDEDKYPDIERKE